MGIGIPRIPPTNPMLPSQGSGDVALNWSQVQNDLTTYIYRTAAPTLFNQTDNQFLAYSAAMTPIINAIAQSLPQGGNSLLNNFNILCTDIGNEYIDYTGLEGRSLGDIPGDENAALQALSTFISVAPTAVSEEALKSGFQTSLQNLSAGMFNPNIDWGNSNVSLSDAALGTQSFFNTMLNPQSGFAPQSNFMAQLSSAYYSGSLPQALSNADQNAIYYGIKDLLNNSNIPWGST